MPLYYLHYSFETCLYFEDEVVVSYKKHRITILFPKKDALARDGHASIEIEAINWQEADNKAQNFIQPTLDAIAFTTGSPLLLSHWEFILKDESGNATRKALWCQKTKKPIAHKLEQRSIAQAQQILSQQDEVELELCWHRYAIQRTLILDRFVFQWLTFEGLAGSRQIPTVCPRCGKEVLHCEKTLSHEGSNRQKAFELFSRIECEASMPQFNKEIWGKARNSVFHGSKYPNSVLLQGLNSLSQKLRRVCESELNQRYGLPDEQRPSLGADVHSYRYNMFEWQTTDLTAKFTNDFPSQAIAKEFENMDDGEVRVADLRNWPFKLLDFCKDSNGW